MDMNMMTQKIPGAGKARGRKKKQPPRRGMGVAQLERTIRTQQHWNLPPHPPTAAGELPPSFPNAMCCPHHHNYNYGYYMEDFNPFHFSPLKKKRANGEEMEAIWGSGTHNMCYLPNHLQGEAPAQVLAVHHKAGKGAHRKLVMEYGFFPSSSSGAAASTSAPGYGYGDATTSIDLSLRL